MRYLVSYDISNSRRLLKMHRLLKHWGRPLQKSVFLVEKIPDLSELTKDILKLIDKQEDDVRIYPIYQASLVWEWEDKMVMEGILLVHH